MQAGTISVVITRIETEDRVTKTFYLKRTDGSPLTYQAGQFLTFLFDFHDHPVRRSYSFSSAPAVDRQVSVTVRRVDNGLVSRFWHERVKVGDIFEVLEPAGRFVLDRPSTAVPFDLVLIGAGSGITPLFALLKQTLATSTDVSILMIYATRNTSLALFIDSLRSLSVEFSERFRLIEVQSQPEDDWDGMMGRLNNGRLQQLLESNLRYKENLLQAFICGPSAFMRTVSITLRFMGVPQNQIRLEYFVTENRTFLRPSSISQTIQIIYKGVARPILVKSGQTILDAGIAAGLPMVSNCRNGSCGVCAVLCRAGEVEMSFNQVLMDRDLNEGWVLTCSGYPGNKPTVLELL